MGSVSDIILGMELNDAKALLQEEGVAFVVRYTETDRKKDYSGSSVRKNRVVRVKEIDEKQEITVCRI